MPQLKNPGGVVHFGGAAVFTMRSADNWVYTVFVGERSGKKFGTYCYKTNPENTFAEWVELPEFTEGRVGITVEHDGVYLSWPINRERDVTRVKLPGFQLPGYPTSGEIAPVPDPVVVQPAPTPVDMVDEVARAYTNAVKKELNGKIAVLEKEIAALKARAVAGGVSEQSVKDYIWTFAKEAIWYELNVNPNGALAGLIRSIVKM